MNNSLITVILVAGFLLALNIGCAHQKPSVRNEVITQPSSENKTQLFETLATHDYQSSEINALKNKIVILDQKRLELMFGALNEVQQIVGRGQDKEKIYRDLRNYDRPHEDRMTKLN